MRSARNTRNALIAGNRAPNRHRNLEIAYHSIDQLTLDPLNPRLHSKKQLKQIARSIEVFGFNVPVIIDAKSRVIAGHGRISACKLLGLTEVPTIRLEHLTEQQVRAFVIADNKLTENAAWDERLLAQQFQELSSVDLNFHLEDTGFEMGEIDLLIEGLAPMTEGETDPADDIPASGSAVSIPGDLWMLGPHRIYCGSALDAASYQNLMPDQKARMVITDPPYNVRIQGHASGLGRVQHKDFVMASGEMTEIQFTFFLTQTCLQLTNNSVDGSIHFIFMDWRHQGELLAAGRQAYTELKNVCVWVKDNAGMGSLFRSQHEFCFVFKNGHAPHQNHIQLGEFGRYRTNIWNYPGVNSFSRSTGEGNLLALHPTVKPVALIADAIMDCSSRGDIILDAFLGSGTAVLAAERTGRICFGIDLDPTYVDTSVRRWQAYTGQIARHAQTNKSFSTLELERAQS
ncbi:MAG: DNA methyltransferase [Gammaproteobacteria bacterium]